MYRDVIWLAIYFMFKKKKLFPSPSHTLGLDSIVLFCLFIFPLFAHRHHDFIWNFRKKKCFWIDFILFYFHHKHPHYTNTLRNIGKRETNSMEKKKENSNKKSVTNDDGGDEEEVKEKDRAFEILRYEIYLRCVYAGVCVFWCCGSFAFKLKTAMYFVEFTHL